LPKQGILIDKGWKWHAGDNPDFEKVDFDDSKWESIDPTKDILDIPQLWSSDIGWFRIKFTVDSSILYNALALAVSQIGAAEYFLNGQPIGSFGKIETKPINITAEEPLKGSSLALPINKAGVQTLSIRFAVQKNIPYHGKIPLQIFTNNALNLKVVNAANLSS